MKKVIKNGLSYLRMSAAEASLYKPLHTIFAVVKNGGYTWQSLVGPYGHAQQLSILLDREQMSFRDALMVFFDDLGRWMTMRAIDGVQLVDTEDVDKFDQILHMHARRSALVAAAIEWEMHRRHRQVKDIYVNVRKGLIEMISSLPGEIADAVISRVSATVSKAEDLLGTVTEQIGLTMDRKKGRAHIREEVQRVLGMDAARSRAEAIAATEGTRAFGAGGYEAAQIMQVSGQISARRWMTMHGTGGDDGKVRNTHRQANGQIVRPGERFQLVLPSGHGIEYCDYPCDPILSAGNSCRCRCLAVGVLL